MNLKGILIVVLFLFGLSFFSSDITTPHSSPWVQEMTFETFQEGNEGVFGFTLYLRMVSNAMCCFLKYWMVKAGFVGGILVFILGAFAFIFPVMIMPIANLLFSFSVLGAIGSIYDSVTFAFKMLIAIFGIYL